MDIFKNIVAMLKMDFAAEKESVLLSEMLRANPTPWGKRRLSRYKTMNGKRYQLHATRGWKCVGRAKAEGGVS